MAYEEVIIQECTPAHTVKGDPYLKMTLKGIGWVSCFDEKCFDLLKQAYATGEPIEVDLVEQENPRNPNKMWRRVEGIKSLDLGTGGDDE